MAILTNKKDYTVDSLPQLNVKKDGSAQEYSDLGNNTKAWFWTPSKNKPHESPYFTVFPNIGYNFAGFEVKTERKEQVGDPKYIFTAVTKLKNKQGTLNPSLFAEDPDENRDWATSLVKYTAKFNKNIYNIVAESRFYLSDAKTLITDINGDELKTVGGISIDLTPVSRAAFALNRLKSGSTTGLTVSPFESSSIPTSNYETALKQAIQNRMTFDFDNKNSVFTAVTDLRKDNFFTIGDSFKLTAIKALTVRRYSFGGWFYVKKKGVTPDKDILAPLPILSSESENINQSNIRQVTLSSDFIHYKVFDSDLTGLGYHYDNILPLYDNGQMTIVAKWNQVAWNIEMTSDPLQGNVSVGNEMIEGAIS